MEKEFPHFYYFKAYSSFLREEYIYIIDYKKGIIFNADVEIVHNEVSNILDMAIPEIKNDKSKWYNWFRNKFLMGACKNEILKEGEL